MTNEPDTNPDEGGDTALAPEPEHPEDAGDAQLDAIRELVLRAHPDVVPELIAGTTIAEMLASVTPARAAWQRLAERIGTPPAIPPVPAGGEKPVAIDPERLSASEKIRRGLARGR